MEQTGYKRKGYGKMVDGMEEGKQAKKRYVEKKKTIMRHGLRKEGI
jgi:hypothetical protein